MQKDFNKKLAILSISIFLMSHLAIAPAIPKLFTTYNSINKNIGLASVESLVTIPAMMITIFLILSNFVISFLGKRNTIILGLILIGLSGIIPFFTTNFTFVIIARLLLGIGIGLYNAISISIISDYYDGEQRATMIGMRTAFLNIGKAITTFIAGYILVFGTNYVYLVYLLTIPVLLYFSINIKDNKKEIKNIKSVTIFNKNLFLLMTVTFLVGISYIGATVKIPTLLSVKYGFSQTDFSNILSILALSGIIIGFIFGKLIKLIEIKTMLVMILAMILGNILFAISNSIIIFYFAAILIGASFVGIMSSVFFYITKTYKKEQINFVTSMTLTAGNIGVIVTPLILTKIPEKLMLEPLITPFYITTLLMIINVGIYLLLTNKQNKINIKN